MSNMDAVYFEHERFIHVDKTRSPREKASGVTKT